MSDERQLQVRCGTHGIRVPAVVCRHIVNAGESRVGFVENSTHPDDLQAWCNECEHLFLREGALTPAFREFNGMRVVCDFCYAAFKDRQCA